MFKLATKLALAALLCCTPSLVFGGDPPASRFVIEEVSTESWSAPRTTIPLDEDYWLFDPHEFHLELAYLKMDNESAPNNRAHNDEENDGFAIGAFYYTKRWLAFGAEYLHAPGFSAENVLLATVRFRIPIDEAGIAISFFGGGGAILDGGESNAVYHVGVGIEFRLTDSLSLTMDYRFIGPDPEIQAFNAGLNLIY